MTEANLSPSLKEKLKAEITDQLLDPSGIPAIQKSVTQLTSDFTKKQELYKAYPGVLLLGDWHGAEVSLAFFDKVKATMALKHRCNAFTLNDITQKLKREQPGTTPSTAEIREKGLNEAQVVLLVDGSGSGTVAECAVIGKNPIWNAKCYPFVQSTPQNYLKIKEERSHLRDFTNHPQTWNSTEELEALLISRGIHEVESWIKKELKEKENTK